MLRGPEGRRHHPLRRVRQGAVVPVRVCRAPGDQVRGRRQAARHVQRRRFLE